MSAWLVSKTHIDVLVTAAISLDVIDRDQATVLGTLLWAENYRSLNARYGDPIPEVDYLFRPEAVEDPYFVYKQLACYDYQACESDDYEKTDAFANVEAMTLVICKRLNKTEEEIISSELYKAAPWGVS